MDRNGVYLFNLFKKKKDNENLDYTDVNIDLMKKLNQSNKHSQNSSISYRLKNFFLPEKNSKNNEEVTQVNIKSIPQNKIKKNKYDELVTPDNFFKKKIENQDQGTIAQIPSLPEMTTTRTIATSELSNKLKDEEFINDKADTLSVQGGALLSKEDLGNKVDSVSKEDRPRFPDFNPSIGLKNKKNQVFDEDSKMYTDVHLLGGGRERKSFFSKIFNFKNKSVDETRYALKNSLDRYSDEKTVAGQDGGTVILKAPLNKNRKPKLKLILIIVLIALVASILFQNNEDNLVTQEKKPDLANKKMVKSKEKKVAIDNKEQTNNIPVEKSKPVVAQSINEEKVEVKEIEEKAISTDMSAKPVEKIEVKKSIPKKIVQESSNKISVVNIIYTNPGRGLVYNCINRHWACIDETNFKKCKDSIRICKSFELYPSNKDCSQKQISNINQNLKISFCN